MSNRVTQKYLRSLEREGLATNINQWDEAQLNEIRHKGLATVSVSVGVNGLNGAELQDDDGNRYVIVGRNTTLARMV